MTDRAALLGELLAYARTDLLCYRVPALAEGPLREVQDAAFDPILDWVRDTHGAHFVVTDGIMPIQQDMAAIAAIEKAFAEATDAHLHLLAELCQLLGSALLALAVWQKRITVSHAVEYAYLDETAHAQRYGVDPVVEAARKAKMERVQALVKTSFFN